MKIPQSHPDQHLRDKYTQNSLVLGMFATLNPTHHVHSNPTSLSTLPRLRRKGKLLRAGRESDLGRYDVYLTPKDHSKPDIRIEFKKVAIKKDETLEAVAQQALDQIEERNYEAEMRAQDITHIIKLGIAFAGKESLVVIG